MFQTRVNLKPAARRSKSSNPFTPKFLKWPLPALNLDMSTIAKVDTRKKKKKKNRMANSVVPDKTAPYEPSHLDLCCLQIKGSVLVFRPERV